MGNIKSGNFKQGKDRKDFRDRTGESRKMNNGLIATIIKYCDGHNIDIQFENGQIVKHKQYDSFLKGCIRQPMIYTVIEKKVKCENPDTGLIFFIDKIDLNKIKKYHWNERKKGYITNSIKGVLHRYLLDLNENEFIDHIDGNPKNNCRDNLRICTNAENTRNRKKPKTNTSGYKGVSWHKFHKRWSAKITSNEKQHHLGYFTTANEAYNAYCIAAKKYHKEFANYG
jgi:hypothetical protein